MYNLLSYFKTTLVAYRPTCSIDYGGGVERVVLGWPLTLNTEHNSAESNNNKSTKINPRGPIIFRFDWARVAVVNFRTFSFAAPFGPILDSSEWGKFNETKFHAFI